MNSSDDEDPQLSKFKKDAREGKVKDYRPPKNDKLSYLEQLDRARETYRNN